MGIKSRLSSRTLPGETIQPMPQGKEKTCYACGNTYNTVNKVTDLHGNVTYRCPYCGNKVPPR
jgi:DNA-directed RNA polymerase subunit RPC12/RpoP